MLGIETNHHRGREQQKAMTDNNYEQLSTGQPTYWPADRNKIPHVLDFFVIKNIAQIYTNLQSSLEVLESYVNSDHPPFTTISQTGQR